MMCAHCGDRTGPLLVNEGLTECENYVECQRRIEWDGLAKTRPPAQPKLEVRSATFIGADGNLYAFAKVS